MQFKCFIRNMQKSSEALQWCFSNLDHWGGRWIRWTDDGNSVFKFAHEEDYLCFLLKFGKDE